MISLFSVFYLINIFLISHSNGNVMVDRLRWDFLNLENDVWKYIQDQVEHGFNDTADPGVVLINNFYNYDKEVQEMPQDILSEMNVVRQVPQFLYLFSDIRIINDMYDKFRRFLVTGISNSSVSQTISVVDERETKMSYIIEEVMNDPKNNMNKTVYSIYKHAFHHNEDGNILHSLFNILLDDYFCKDFKQTPQQVFYNLYNLIALVDLKAYIMIQFSYLAQSLEEKVENISDKSLSARKLFQMRTDQIVSITDGAMRMMPNDLWICDPRNHVKGSTYDELTALLQGHIENEVDLNERGTCKENCAAYPYAKSYGCYDSDSPYCSKRKPCSGKILNCRFVESHITACFSPSYSSRRYEYIEYKSGKLLGKKHRCENRNINSWFRWFVHCSYCLCLCDQEGIHSDRYFNLRPVMSDIANNRVVTGFRIVKKNRLIHLQIQEGQLLPYGYVDNSTVRWVPIDDYKITDAGVKYGEDYHTMNYQRRTLFLDELAPHEENHIITGMGFIYIDNHLKFQINVRGFNFENGTLSKDSYYVYGTRNSFRQKIRIDNSDIPILSPQSEKNLETDTYVEFTHSSFDKDAAQTTVPFFDVQPVSTNPALPLKGAGIYYKGKFGYGGFVAPKITTYDFRRHMNPKFPEVAPRHDNFGKFPIIA